MCNQKNFQFGKSFALKFHGPGCHFKIYKTVGADLNFEVKKLVFLMFHCVLLALASQKERRQRLIILHIWNTFFSDFILSSIYSLC